MRMKMKTGYRSVGRVNYTNDEFALLMILYVLSPILIPLIGFPIIIFLFMFLRSLPVLLPTAICIFLILKTIKWLRE